MWSKRPRAGGRRRRVEGDVERGRIRRKSRTKGRESRALSGLEGTPPQASSFPLPWILHDSVHTTPLTLLGACRPSTRPDFLRPHAAKSLLVPDTTPLPQVG